MRECSPKEYEYTIDLALDNVKKKLTWEYIYPISEHIYFDGSTLLCSTVYLPQKLVNTDLIYCES